MLDYGASRLMKVLNQKIDVGIQSIITKWGNTQRKRRLKIALRDVRIKTSMKSNNYFRRKRS